MKLEIKMRGSGSLLILLTLLGHYCSVSTLYSDVSQDVVISGHLDQDDKMTRSSRPLETISTFPVSKNDKYYKESHSTQQWQCSVFSKNSRHVSPWHWCRCLAPGSHGLGHWCWLMSDVWSSDLSPQTLRLRSRPALIIGRWYYHGDISVKLNLTETCLSSSGSLYGQWSCYFGQQRKYLIWADNGGGMWRWAEEDRGQLCRVTMMTMAHDGPTRWPL